jgi:hypothetical protein
VSVFIIKNSVFVELSSCTCAETPFNANPQLKVGFSKSTKIATFMVKSWNKCLWVFSSKKIQISLSHLHTLLLKRCSIRILSKKSVFSKSTKTVKFMVKSWYRCLWVFSSKNFRYHWVILVNHSQTFNPLVESFHKDSKHLSNPFTRIQHWSNPFSRYELLCWIIASKLWCSVSK